jgi:predicted PurR-regulated permease PerM
MTDRLPGLRALVLLAVVALVLLIPHLLAAPLRHVLLVLITAVVVAAAVSPAATALHRHHVPRGVTVLLVYLGAVLLLGVVVALIAPLVSGEARAFEARLPGYEREIRDLVGRVAPEHADLLTGDTVVEGALRQAGEWLTRAEGVAFSLSGVVVRGVIVLVMAYFMAVEGDFPQRLIDRFAPPPHRPRLRRLAAVINDRLGRWARAQLLLALYFGVLFGLGLRVMGLPYAITLGVIGGVLEIVPYVGGFVTVVLALLVALTERPWLVLPVLVWYTVVVQVEGHVLAPLLMGRAVGMHPLVVLAALFLGIEVLGILGALLAVPIAVIFQALLDEFYPTVADEAAPRPAAGAARPPVGPPAVDAVPEPRLAAERDVE